jgi:hypothetical protein
VGGETGTVHMEQCLFSNLQGGNGANPSHNPSLKKKAVNETPVEEPNLVD